MLRLTAKTSIVLISLFFFLSLNSTAKVIEQIIAIIDGEPYTLSNFSEYATKRMNRNFPQGNLNQIGKEDQEVLEQFITEKLLEAEVRESGIKVTEEDVARYIGQIREKNSITEEELKTALSREGVTIESYRATIKGEIEKSEIINRQVRKRVNITAEDVERYYQLNRKKYTTEQRVRLRHILFALSNEASPEHTKEAHAKAGGIYKRIAAGEDFSKLAKEYSEGAGASEGGDIGWVSRGSLLKEIEEIAFEKLSVGEVSQPLRTSLGFHLIKLEARDGGTPLPFSVVQGQVKEELYATALEERFQKWLKSDLRRKHRVEVKLPGVVFRPEETKEGTVNSLIASASRRNRKEDRSFLSYLNPFSYIFRETPVEGEEAPGQLSGKNIVSLFGVPLFTTESADNIPEDPLAPLGTTQAPAPKTEESSGSSSFWSIFNPFSRKP